MSILVIVLLSTATSCALGQKDNSPSINELSLRIKESLAKENYLEAIQGCDSLLAIDSNSVWGKTRKATALLKLERYNDSHSLFNEVIASDSGIFEAYYWRANCRKALGDSLMALDDFNRALQIEPSSKEALNSRGFLYALMNRNDSAIQDFNKALEIEPTFLLARKNVTNIYEKMGLYDSAIAVYSRGIEISRTAELYDGRGVAYYKAGQFDSAVADFTQAIKYNPSISEVFLHRAYAYSELGNRIQMCEDFSTAAALGNKTAKTFYELNCHKM